MKFSRPAAGLALAVMLSSAFPGIAFAKHQHVNASSDGDQSSHHRRHHKPSASSDDAQPGAAADSADSNSHLTRHQRLIHQKRLAQHQQKQAHLKRLAALQQKQAHGEHLAAIQQKAHLRRLAAVQMRQHLARLHHMSRAERIALKQHNQRLAAQRAHELRLAKIEHLHNLRLAQRDSALRPANRRQSRVAWLRAMAAAEHSAKLQALHEARLQKLQSLHEARLAKVEAIHEARLLAHERAAAEAALEHQAAMAQRIAAHNARLAEQKAHYVAMHGDDTGGRSIVLTQLICANVPVKVITVDLNDPNVKVSAVMSQDGDGTAEPFHRMIDRASPNVAVTGTFFSLDNLRPIGDIVIDGSLVHFGGMGTALCVTGSNRADMVTCQWGRHHDWSPYDFVVACGPRLLSGGQIVLDPHAERFKDRHMLAPNSRIAVGITAMNKLMFVMTREPIYLGRLAKVMRGLGCREAMNLDAGTSTGFYYNGTTLASPGRHLTNMIVVYGTRERYERALDQLVPPAYRRFATAHRQASTLP